MAETQYYREQEFYDSGYRVYRPNGTLLAEKLPESRLISYTNKKDTSAKNPDWREDIRAGRSATTFGSGTLKKVRLTPAYFNGRNLGGYVYEGSSILADQSGSFPSVQYNDAAAVDCRTRAKERYFKKSTEILTQFQGLTFLGELRESLMMIKRPASAIRKKIGDHGKAMKSKTKKLKPGSQSMADTVAGSWLEAVFGWQPLINDVDDGMRALANRFYPDNRRLIPVNGRDETRSVSEVPTALHSEAIAEWSGISTTTRRDETNYFGRVKWDPSNISDFRYWGVSFSDILPTAWELIPYSFAIDYFTNIGDIISSWSYGTSHLAWTDYVWYGEATTEVLNTYYGWHLSGSHGSAPLDQPASFDFIAPEQIFTTRSWRRAHYGGSFVADFSWDIPGVGSKKWLNLAALAKLKFW